MHSDEVGRNPDRSGPPSPMSTSDLSGSSRSVLVRHLTAEEPQATARKAVALLSTLPSSTMRLHRCSGGPRDGVPDIVGR